MTCATGCNYAAAVKETFSKFTGRVAELSTSLKNAVVKTATAVKDIFAAILRLPCTAYAWAKEKVGCKLDCTNFNCFGNFFSSAKK